MQSSSSILIYGHDAGVLETRRLLLESVGFTVTAAMEPATISQLLNGPAFDLSVLCHTLSREERDPLTRGAEERKPGMKIIIMTALEGVQGYTDGHAVVNVFDGPGTLVSRVKSLLNVAETEGKLID